MPRPLGPIGGQIWALVERIYDFRRKTGCVCLTSKEPIVKGNRGEGILKQTHIAQKILSVWHYICKSLVLKKSIPDLGEGQMVWLYRYIFSDYNNLEIWGKCLCVYVGSNRRGNCWRRPEAYRLCLSRLEQKHSGGKHSLLSV